jgi:hypothetical protein
MKSELFHFDRVYPERSRVNRSAGEFRRSANVKRSAAVCDWARLSVDGIAGCVDFREHQDSLHANGIHRGLLGLTGSGVLLLLTLGVWYFGHKSSDTKSIGAPVSWLGSHC